MLSVYTKLCQSGEGCNVCSVCRESSVRDMAIVHEESSDVKALYRYAVEDG